MKRSKLDPVAFARKYQLVIYWSEEDGCFLAEAPELRGCITHGNTEREAISRGRDAIVSWLEAAREFEVPVPVPAKNYSGRFVVRVGKSLHRDLSKRAEVEGLSLNQLVLSILRKNV